MTARHMDIHGYCDSLYTELSHIKTSLSRFVHQIEQMEKKDRSVLNSHLKHLNEIIKTVDWKLEIFAKECPVDWNKFGMESEGNVSVPSSESLKEKDFPSGGYAGG